MLYAFLSLLSGGMLLALALSRLEQISWKYLRLVAMMVLASMVGIVVWGRLGPSPLNASLAVFWPTALTAVTALSAACLVFIAPLVEARPILGRLTCMVGGVAGVLAGHAWTWSVAGLSAHGDLPVSAVNIVVGQWSSALFLGTMTTAWLLGHAYLTATKMTIEPLHRLSRLLMVAVLGRMCVTAWGLVALWLSGQAPGVGITDYWMWIMIFLRVGVGLVAVAIFAYMILDCVRRRSTQSATGILYFASVFTYIGELCSLHLIGQLGYSV